jgi:hypothetical protein
LNALSEIVIDVVARGDPYHPTLVKYDEVGSFLSKFAWVERCYNNHEIE